MKGDPDKDVTDVNDLQDRIRPSYGFQGVGTITSDASLVDRGNAYVFNMLLIS